MFTRKYLIFTFIFLALGFLLPFTPYLYPSESLYYRLMPVIIFSGLAIFSFIRYKRPEGKAKPKDKEENDQEVVWLEEEPKTESEPEESVEFVDLEEK